MTTTSLEDLFEDFDVEIPDPVSVASTLSYTALNTFTSSTPRQVIIGADEPDNSAAAKLKALLEAYEKEWTYADMEDFVGDTSVKAEPTYSPASILNRTELASVLLNSDDDDLIRSGRTIMVMPEAVGRGGWSARERWTQAVDHLFSWSSTDEGHRWWARIADFKHPTTSVDLEEYLGSRKATVLSMLDHRKYTNLKVFIEDLIDLKEMENEQ